MPVVRISTVVPLSHFELAGHEPLTLDVDFLMIRRLSGEERSIMEKHLGLYGTIHPQFGVVYAKDEKRPEMPSEKLGKKYREALDQWLSHVDMDSGYRHIRRVIEAMRLFATGDVGTNLYMNLFAQGNETGYRTECDATGSGGTYKITPQTREPFIRFWSNYSTRDVKPILRHLSRFMRAYGRGDLYDRLVDFVTSMEGLVLPGTTQELRKQFALRVAYLLGGTRRERKSIFDEALDIYDKRSKIVHGEAEERQDEALYRRAEDMDRRLLVLALERPELFARESLEMLVLGS